MRAREAQGLHPGILGSEVRPNLSENLFPAGFAAELTFHDLDELAGASWDLEYHQLGRGAFEARMQLAFTSRLHLGIESYKPGLRLRGSAPGSAYVVVFHSGGAALHDCGRRVPASEIVVCAPGDALDLTAPAEFQLMVALVARGLFEAHVARRWGNRRFAGPLPRQLRFRTPEARRHVIQAWRRTLRRALDAPHMLVERDAARNFEEKLLGLLLAALETRPPGREEAARLRVARRAEKMLRGHLSEPIALATMCRILGVPARTLHQGFLEAYGTTPKAYLTMLRLNAARRDLSSAASRATVTEVALR